MNSYVFDLINRDGSIDSFELGAFDQDVDALRHGGHCLRSSPAAFAIDVYRQGVRVGRLRRDAA